MSEKRPLADEIRPLTLDEVVGQKHLLGKGALLRRLIESGSSANMIFYGPSGTGKTTIANIIANRTNKTLYRLNATTASLQDVKSIISDVGTMMAPGGILLYLDEIQYFNKKQQQSLLEFMENGSITLIASTTENPYFYVYGALLSRSTVFEFKPLTPDDISDVLDRAIGILSEEKGKEIIISDDAKKKISRAAAGDVRRSLNMLELCVLTSENETEIDITDDTVEEIAAANAVRYDREGDEHYDIISAYQKSMRGSDPDAAVYYLGRLLAAGDLPSACRRLMVCACEDVGLAYPQIIPIVKAAVDIAQSVGLPEARLPLADAVILVATSPKSNSGHNAIVAAMEDIEKGIGGPIPRQLQNKHFDGEEAETKGQNYKYPHDFKNHYVNQQYLPSEIEGEHFYELSDMGYEKKLKEHMKKIHDEAE